jgi:hypothetical protein
MRSKVIQDTKKLYLSFVTYKCLEMLTRLSREKYFEERCKSEEAASKGQRGRPQSQAS